MKKIFLLLLLWYFVAPTNILNAQDQNRVDSLKNVLESTTVDTTEINTLIRLAKEYRKTDKQESHSFSNKALKLSIGKKYIPGEAAAFYYLGIASTFAREYQEAIEYQRKALQKYILLEHEEKQADCLRKIGSLHLYTGDFAEAIKYILKSVPIYELLKDSIEVAGCYNNIAIAYFNSQNEEKAEEYLMKAGDLYKLLGSDQDIFPIYLGLGNVNENKEDYKKAEEYYLKCLKIAKKLDIDEMRSVAIASLGVMYNSLGKHKEAIAAMEEGIDISKKLENLSKLTSSYSNLSSTYIALEEWNNALAALDSAEKYSTENSYLIDFEVINLNYSLIYEQKGEYKKALEARKEYSSIRDSIHRIENTDKINELTVQYETVEKENDIIRLEADKKANELELIKKDKERNTIIGITALLLLSLIFSYFYWRQKQISNAKTIALNKERINSLLKENKIDYANAMIEGQEAERKRLAEDLHDRVGSILSTMKLHLSSTKDGSIEKAKILLDESVDEVRKISHNLASISLVKFGLVASLQSLSESLVSDDFKVSFIHHGVDEKLPSKIAIALYRCVQELISNVLKHSNATKLTIQLQKNEDQINLIIEDNGQGFDPSKEFTGIGLKNITSRVKSIDGQINFDSLPQKGTTVIIDIPLKS
jgi:signal transduction histidine kinase